MFIRDYFFRWRGSPWEQPALLVYLLRQAGGSAFIVENTYPSLILGGEGSYLTGETLAKVTQLSFPWVRYYEPAKRNG